MSTEAPTTPEKKNYKQTLNLPQTAFAMEAKLVQNEPKRLAAWEEGRLYEKIITSRASSPKGRWVLHDGPPFANGDIHIGHVINKTLKDVILRFRTMQGYQTPYVPGWDCHGFPIVDSAAASRLFGLAPYPVHLLVWTTTPWTLPANLAIAVHPDVEYLFATLELSGSNRTVVVAKDLAEKILGFRPSGQPVVYL